MDDVKNEAQAAERMIEQLEANQAAKAEKRAKRAEEVAEAMAEAQEVAAHVAAGEVAPAQVTDKVTSATEFDPAAEAEAGARMIDDLLAGKAEKAAKHAKQVEALGEDLLEEAGAAYKVAESVKATAAHFKEKLGL